MDQQEIERQQAELKKHLIENINQMTIKRIEWRDVNCVGVDFEFTVIGYFPPEKLQDDPYDRAMKGI